MLKQQLKEDLEAIVGLDEFKFVGDARKGVLKYIKRNTDKDLAASAKARQQMGPHVNKPIEKG